jgi:hypothetical protein
MKIYTYYEEINFPQQKEMLELWRKSWTQMGFEAIVLNQQDAKKSPDYDLFVRKMQYIFQEITNQELTPYGLSCFVRWLAYSTVSDQEEKFLVSDYDVINSGGWKTSDPLIDGLHLFDDACPCMASGTAKDFKKLCDLFFEITILRLPKIKEQANHYHDQEFFLYNFVGKFNKDSETLKKQYNITLTRKRNEDVAPWFPDPSRAYHVSHHNVEILMKKYPKKYGSMNDSQARIKIIKNILDNQ